MPFSSKAIANELLDIAWEKEASLTPMKLQKLVYYAQGWHLALKKTALVFEQIEAWEYGPVVVSLYHEFKGFGNRPITLKATHLENDLFTEKMPCIDDDIANPSLSPPSDEDKLYAKAFLKKIWDTYGGYTAIQLSNQTHIKGGAWDIIRNNSLSKSIFGGTVPRGTDIPAQTIEECFEEMLEKESIW